MKKILCVIDMQNDFIDENVLGTKEAVMIIPKVKEKIEQYKAKNDFIIFTRDTHSKDYLGTAEGRKLPVEHCIENTLGWEINKELDTTECKIINKYTFGSVDLANTVTKLLDIIGTEQVEIELVGLCTDICVISNALILKASNSEAEIIVDASCCAGTTPKNHKISLDAMKMCQIEIKNEQ